GLEAQDGLYEQALNNINQALRKRSKSTSFILMKANLLMALRNALDLEKTVMANVSEGSDFVDVNGNRRHIYSYLQDFLFSP
ncbi:hypothetical protein, partial [Acinetobacter colistiniresistens]|uniref:hypothetical protein n=1 Tax=Acinetobacter colistiniresistens TaxID=280145 RepID=UPI001250ACB8